MKKYIISALLMSFLLPACSSSVYKTDNDFAFNPNYYYQDNLEWKEVDKVWALIDGRPILKSEVEKKFEEINSKKKIKKNKVAYEKSRILDSIINLKIIESNASKNGIIVSEENIDNKIKEVMEMNDLKDQKELIAFVKKTSKMNYDEYREYIRQQTLTRMLMIYSIDYNRPSEEEAKDFYKKQVKKNSLPFTQVSIEYLTVTPKNKTFSEQKRVSKIINGARSQALKGKSLASIAASNSSIKYTTSGGYKRLAELDRYIAGYVHQVMKRRGQLSAVHKTPSGYHIIKYYGKRVAPFEDFKNIIFRMMDAQAGQEALDYWLKRQRNLASVKIYMNEYVPEKEK